MHKFSQTNDLRKPRRRDLTIPELHTLQPTLHTFQGTLSHQTRQFDKLSARNGKREGIFLERAYRGPFLLAYPTSVIVIFKLVGIRPSLMTGLLYPKG